MSKKKDDTPKRKRLKRPERLKRAPAWLKTYNGKNVVKGYSKWFGVDKLCAIKELRKTGLAISQEYEERIENARDELAKIRKHEEDTPFSDETYAVIVGYTPNGVPFGTIHNEMEAINNTSEDGPPDEDIASML